MASTEGLRRSLQGLSEVAFRERFGTEQACRAALFELRWREGLTRPACGHRGFRALKTRKLFPCRRCKKQVRLTAGTVFQDSKLPLTAWFSAIYHLTQSKGGISSIELARRLGVRQPTAWLLKPKLMRAMAEREARKPQLQGRVEIDDAYLGGERSGGRRGRGAAGTTPIVAAVETPPERTPRRLKLTVVKGFRQKGSERLAQRDLAPGGNVASDRLSRWPAVAKAGGCPFPMITGSGKRAARWAPFRSLGEHDAGRHQDRDRRHLPPRQRQARPKLPHQLRLPLQSPLPARQHRPAPRLGRGPHRAAALPDHPRGCVRGMIRNLYAVGPSGARP
jgi:hypothetical protein